LCAYLPDALEWQGFCKLIIVKERVMSRIAATPVHTESTDVRFSMRLMLLIAVPVAVVAAVAGQCIRAFGPQQQTQIALAWAGWVLLAIGCLALIARKRVRVEKLAGRTIIRLPIYGMNPNWRVINRYVLSAYLMSIGIFELFEIAGRAASSTPMQTALFTLFNLDSIFTAWLLATCIALWWWPRDIRLCENGVLSDQRLIPWSDARARWDPDHDAVTIYGSDQSGVELHFDMVVPEQQHALVEVLLKEKLDAV
jgi:hypothetical protein